MMSLLSGLPGAGKTSMIVEKYLMPLAANDWIEDAIDEDGNKVKVKRKLFTNINGLLLEHEKIGADELNTWPQWVKPGDIILYDEIQKPWPKVPAGTKKPDCIEKLETHRHYGIDIVGLTQHPMLVNDAYLLLASRHQHVRKVASSRYATIYEWDGVSKTLNYKNSLSKTPWRRSKAVEKMYRSSALHTAQKRSVPTVLFVVIAALLIFPAGAYWWSGKFKQRYFGAGATAAASAPSAPAGLVFASIPSTSSSQPAYMPAGGPLATAVPSKPKLIGCLAKLDRCECYDQTGAWVETEVQQCRSSAGRGGVLVPYELHSPFVAAVKSLPHPDDRDNVAPVMAAFSDGQVKR